MQKRFEKIGLRTQTCHFPAKANRGDFIEKHDKPAEISIVSWMNSKEVMLASNFLGQVSRFLKKKTAGMNLLFQI